jgi:spore coat protein U-like protein
MNFSNLTRTGTALVAGAALFAAVSAIADASPATFNVTTTISASCNVNFGGPTDLAPTYSPASDTSVGDATGLSTTCTGTTPSVVFTDQASSGTTQFVMLHNGTDQLNYQISLGTSCSGISQDSPITEGASINLVSGVNQTLDICAAVIVGQTTGIASGLYGDTVTYTITP